MISYFAIKKDPAGMIPDRDYRKGVKHEKEKVWQP